MIKKPNQIDKLIWLIKTIHRAGRISYEDLNQEWIDYQESSGFPTPDKLPKRTLLKWKGIINETYHLNIKCEKGTYLYYIDNYDELRQGSIEKWLIQTHSAVNSVQSCVSIKNRILLEDIPSGEEHLDAILQAMKHNQIIQITYHSYWRMPEHELHIMPLCVKLFRQRWYVVGKRVRDGEIRVYCLDRIRELIFCKETFVYPNDFDPQLFFSQSFGIISGDDSKYEHVVLKVSSNQANYLRALPMHESQKEIECTKDYSIFELYVKVTYDFIQELFWNNIEVEVLKPATLRGEILWRAKNIVSKYE